MKTSLKMNIFENNYLLLIKNINIKFLSIFFITKMGKTYF